MNEPTSIPQTPDQASATPPGAEPASMAALADAVRQLAQSHQSLLDALRPRGSSAGSAPAPYPFGIEPRPANHSAEDVRRVVDQALTARDATARRTAARDRYVREKMADLPEAYRRLMPESEDDAALAAAERDVRGRFREDLRSFAGPAGATAADVAGDAGAAAGQRPGAAVDYSALSPLQQIALGLKGARPAAPRPGLVPPDHPSIAVADRARFQPGNY